jgi:hypothetical protein
VPKVQALNAGSPNDKLRLSTGSAYEVYKLHKSWIIKAPA